MRTESAEDNDDDTVSSTSTIDNADGTGREYTVDCILAEMVDDDGQKYYLIRWEDYPLEDSTWEPEENILTRVTLQNWAKEKDRVSKGLSKAFDVQLYYDAVENRNKAKVQRKQERSAKRNRRGVTRRLTKREKHNNMKRKHVHSSDSNSPAKEDVDEVSDVKPGVEVRRKPVPMSKLEQFIARTDVDSNEDISESDSAARPDNSLDIDRDDSLLVELTKLHEKEKRGKSSKEKANPKQPNPNVENSKAVKVCYSQARMTCFKGENAYYVQAITCFFYRIFVF